MQKRDKNHENRDENVISSEGLRKKKIQLRAKQNVQSPFSKVKQVFFFEIVKSDVDTINLSVLLTFVFESKKISLCQTKML